MEQNKLEFDNIEEYETAVKDLSKYHDCKKCHGKIVLMDIDKLGNTHCGYCNQIVQYPKLSSKALLEEIERIKNTDDNKL